MGVFWNIFYENKWLGEQEWPFFAIKKRLNNRVPLLQYEVTARAAEESCEAVLNIFWQSLVFKTMTYTENK